MAKPEVGSTALEILVPLIMAISLALVIGTTKPTLSLILILGAFPMVVAFLSPLAGLYLLVFSMLLGPELLVGGGMGSGTTLGRGVTLRYDDFILLLVGVAWLARTAISKQGNLLLRTPLNRPIMLYTAACVLATLMGILTGLVRPVSGFFFLLKYYEYFFLYFMTVNVITSQKQIRSVVWASLATCFLVSLYAISQIPSGQRVSAPFEGESGEPNTLGGYLVFMLAIVTGLLMTPGAVTQKLPLVILMGVGGIALQGTLSRSSFLAAGVVILGVLGLVWRKNPLYPALFLIALLTAPWWTPHAVTERIMYTFAQPQEEGQIRLGSVRVDTSTSDRLRSWRQSLDYFQRSPLWGAGVTGGPFIDAMYPRVLVETGLLGSCAFLVLLWAVFRTGVTGYQQVPDPFMRGVTLGFLLGFGGLLVHAIGANTFIIVRIMEPFWLYAALIVRMLIMHQAQPASEAGLLAQQTINRGIAQRGHQSA
ncbi:MAG: hypothetical protein E6K63_09635 [Nitrospirae bacterium]|nr:MAG: hypothetical protein E6K63_09635 [Nitrospirota bacterium]